MTPADLNHLLTQVVSWVIAGLMGYGARSVVKLNTNVALLLQQILAHDRSLMDHEERLRKVELHHPEE